jgi:hypothetical protein
MNGYERNPEQCVEFCVLLIRMACMAQRLVFGSFFGLFYSGSGVLADETAERDQPAGFLHARCLDLV